MIVYTFITKLETMEKIYIVEEAEYMTPLLTFKRNTEIDIEWSLPYGTAPGIEGTEPTLPIETPPCIGLSYLNAIIYSLISCVNILSWCFTFN